MGLGAADIDLTISNAPTRPSKGGSPRLLNSAVALVVWTGALVALLSGFAAYDTRPGAVGRLPVSQGAPSVAPSGAGPFTLVMALHPKCPCSAASMTRLERLLEQFPRAFNTRVLIYQPEPALPGWSDTPMVARARRLPNATVEVDAGGREAAELGALTSGMTLVFDGAGVCRFAGGLTDMRGMSDTSEGAALIGAIVQGQAGSFTTPVLGCALKSAAGAASARLDPETGPRARGTCCGEVAR
ncbi:hypothetical protein BH11PLA1_BH11PLA1_16730 [soil metagenome]